MLVIAVGQCDAKSARNSVVTLYHLFSSEKGPSS